MIIAFSINDLVELKNQSSEFKYGFLGGVLTILSLLVFATPLILRYIRKPSDDPRNDPKPSDREISRRIQALKPEKLAGRLWHCGPSKAHVEQARSRKFPVIALVNFKGGVGKTTLTANLAATFCAPDTPETERLRTLVIDCDWQGTLTSWMSTEDDLRHLEEGEKWFHKILEGSSAKTLIGASHPVSNLSNCRLMGASTTLGDMEDISMIKWFCAQPDAVDPRFALREWLNQPPLQEQLDMVLIDCPPRLSAASIAALVAADYVVIPTIPDKLSLYSVKLLLDIIKTNIKPFNSNLTVLGVVLNKCKLYDGVLVKSQSESVKLFAEDLPSDLPDGLVLTDKKFLIKAFQAGTPDWDNKAFHQTEKETFENLAKLIKKRTIRKS